MRYRRTYVLNNTKDREQIDDLQSNQLESAHILEDMQHKMFKIQVLKLHKFNSTINKDKSFHNVSQGCY